MKFLTPRIHGYLDYLIVLVFIIVPLLLGFEGIAAIISFVLAAIQLMLTVLTDFSLGFARLIPIKKHGLFETVLGLITLLLPLLLGIYESTRIFYFIMGAIITVLSLITDYKQASLKIEDISV